MKRYQIHIAKRVVAEVIVEAESEHLARVGVKQINQNQFKWRDDGAITIEHFDQLDGEPEVHGK